MLSGSDSDDQRDEMEESSSSSSGSSCTSSSSSSGGSGGEPPEEEEDDEGDSERRRKRNGSVKREIDIEEGAVLIASWEHTTDLNVRRKVYRELDEIAGTVRQRLAQSAAVDGEEGTAVVARGKEIEGVDEGRILSEVNTTLYDYLGFTGNVNDYMNPNNRCARHQRAHVMLLLTTNHLSLSLSLLPTASSTKCWRRGWAFQSVSPSLSFCCGRRLIITIAIVAIVFCWLTCILLCHIQLWLWYTPRSVGGSVFEST